jgi:hypothetical protein
VRADRDTLRQSLATASPAASPAPAHVHEQPRTWAEFKTLFVSLRRLYYQKEVKADHMRPSEAAMGMADAEHDAKYAWRCYKRFGPVAAKVPGARTAEQPSRPTKPAKVPPYICPECGEEFERTQPDEPK